VVKFGVSGFKEWLKFRKQEMELRSFAIGINSTVDFKKDLHVIFLDYDDVDLERVKESVIECQQFWALSDAYIFKTMHGFHAIFFFDQIPYERLRMIVDFAKDVDPMFKYISRFYNHKTLRVAGKYQERDIVFVGIIDGPREPSKLERELGELKLDEHSALLNFQVKVERVMKK